MNCKFEDGQYEWVVAGRPVGVIHTRGTGLELGAKLGSRRVLPAAHWHTGFVTLEEVWLPSLGTPRSHATATTQCGWKPFPVCALFGAANNHFGSVDACCWAATSVFDLQPHPFT